MSSNASGAKKTDGGVEQYEHDDVLGTFERPPPLTASLRLYSSLATSIISMPLSAASLFASAAASHVPLSSLSPSRSSSVKFTASSDPSSVATSSLFAPSSASFSPPRLRANESSDTLKD